MTVREGAAAASKFLHSRDAEILPAGLAGLTAAVVAGIELLPALGFAVMAALAYSLIQKASN